MKINERLQFQSKQEEINLDKEVSEIAQRIMEKVQQRSTAKSGQKELPSQYLRASDYQARKLFQSYQIEIRRQSEKVTKGPSQEMRRKEEALLSDFKVNKYEKPQELIRFENQLRMGDLKTPLKSPVQPNDQRHNDIHQKTVKLNNYENIGFQEQKSEKMKQIQIMNEHNQQLNYQMHQLSSRRISSPKRDQLKFDSNLQTKSSLSFKTTQLQTPVSVSFKQQDIVTQLLGSLKNQKRNQGDYSTKR
ncbi:unnamed protein product (macronuclear) [Paramecium tetraurelia]|uniref:Uncharacterized protein n=1 Tax=Paramecium tetraurelia TaxID=5888 RepID=A0CJW0_PARTE|nr:uncharacterized protein GSPATT00000789001 [Paramecium tetraurelia]CAK71077.1 unnamed protein product [Paramecium tetraurelia]|eukprot:XP_001438474.1 hypothetical protein (macronuclear) [Paramecium tetraurelia strain d4-2]